MGQAYVSFTRNSTEQIRSKVIDELWILNFFEVSFLITISLAVRQQLTRERLVSFVCSNGIQHRSSCCVTG